MSDPDDTRPFPIQGDTVRNPDGSKDPPSTVPWWLAEVAYKEYQRYYGGHQTLERMAQRGGFGRQELLDLLRGIK
jgi:hypothetical protein